MIELSRCVCTGDPELLAPAGAPGVPACAPAELDAAVRDGTIGELLTTSAQEPGRTISRICTYSAPSSSVVEPRM